MDDDLGRDLDGMEAAHAELLRRLRLLEDSRIGQPSRLPGWTVGHVLAHLARNGESVARRLEAARRGEVVDQYVGGAAARAAAIEAGARRSAALQIADLTGVIDRIDAAVGNLAGGGWTAFTRDVSGTLRPARDLPRARWREVEVHHVDLGLGYEVADWSPGFVERLLPSALADVGRRRPGLNGADPATVLAWTYGRAAPPSGWPELLAF